MEQMKKLKIAISLLQEVSENWDNKDLVNYPIELPSFDEVVCSLGDIEIKDKCTG